MATVRYLVSTKKPGLEFKVVKRRIENEDDPENLKMYLTLEGSHGIQFERLITDAILEKYGYIVELREADHASGPLP
jgi:hypothetical protein